MDLDEKIVTIRREYASNIVRDLPEHKVMTYALHDEVYKMLMRLSKQKMSTFVFVDRQGRPYQSSSKLSRAWGLATRLAGCEGVRLIPSTFFRCQGKQNK